MKKFFFEFFVFLVICPQKLFFNLRILQLLTKMPNLFFFAEIRLSHQAEKTTVIG